MAGQLEFQLKAEKRRVALNVTQLVRMVREALEVHLDECWVVGEISNARVAPSNHLYFTLKDARSAINVVMFASSYRRLRFRVNDGMEVVVRGRVNLYEARGTLQFYAEEMGPRGLGALQLAYDQLKQRLSKEGLFDQAHKRTLPIVPRAIGIVTALGGAALRDMLRTLFDRWPNLHVIIRPATVQGSDAAAAIADAIADLNADGKAEVIIAGRGGGSFEDLWAFNEETVAQAIYHSVIPVVSAVGHEIDYTIADFVADQRAPTPTAAAQIVIPDKAHLRQRLDEIEATLGGAMRSATASHRRQLTYLEVRLRDPRNLLRQTRQRLDAASEELGDAVRARVHGLRQLIREHAARLRTPQVLAREPRLLVSRLAMQLAQALTTQSTPLRLAVERIGARFNEANLRGLIAARRLRVDSTGVRVHEAIDAALEKRRLQLGAAAQRLDAVSPLRVLERGYAVVFKADDGHAIVNAQSVEVGDELKIRLNRGRLTARTTAREI
jgi:exodeoxyribonuclease VII large subunit